VQNPWYLYKYKIVVYKQTKVK